MIRIFKNKSAAEPAAAAKNDAAPTDHVSKGARRAPSIRRHILLYLLAFTAIVIVLICIFQIVLFPSLYRQVRIYETKKCAGELLGTAVDTYENSAVALSEKYNICVTVFRISDWQATVTAESHVNQNCFIHNISADQGTLSAYLTNLYKNAEKDEGYLQSAPLFGNRRDNRYNGDDGGENIIYAVLTDGDDGSEYMMLFNTETYPLASTVSTVRAILVVISITLIILSITLSVLISSYMTRPLTKMSHEAARLALGDFGVHFDSGGYRETGELAETLNRAAKELSNLDKMRKDLIANISHDLRTPLTMIKGYGEVMRDIPGEMTPENMQVIIDETERLTSLVNDILDASRAMSESGALKMEVFSLTQAVKETVSRFSHLCEKDGYRIIFECGRDVKVKADRARILQVIYNLIGNAINYTGDDKTVQIRLTDPNSNGVCRFSVTDSGEGIPEEELPMIWERYYKSGSFHKRPSQGSGIGLSIVKNVLALHGARFGVNSTVGVGSTFWFELKEDSEK